MAFSKINNVIFLLTIFLVSASLLLFAKEKQIKSEIFRSNSTLPYLMEKLSFFVNIVPAKNKKPKKGFISSQKNGKKFKTNFPKIKDKYYNSNIILITVDCVRQDHTSMGGYFRNTTPFLKDLAQESYYFSNSYAASNGTFTSMYSILSGNFPFSVYFKMHPQWFNSTLLPENLMLSEILSSTSYNTYGFNNNNYAPRGWEQGFDSYVNKKSLIIYAKSPAAYRGKKVFKDVLNTIDKQEKNKPFFIWTHLGEPHYPYKPYLWLKSYGSRSVDRYDTLIEESDILIRNFFLELEKRGLLSKTIVIISADHGEHFGEKGNWYHSNTLYQEILHVPLIVRFPNGKKKIWEKAVSTSNVFHWLLPLVIKDKTKYAKFGARKKKAKLFYNEIISYQHRDYTHKEKISWISYPYKFIYSFARKNTEAYNIVKDKKENNNIYYNPIFQEKYQKKSSFFKEIILFSQKELRYSIGKSQVAKKFQIQNQTP